MVTASRIEERMNASRPRSRQGGTSMVEFAIVFPVASMVLIGLAVLGVLVTNQIALNNAVHDGARAAAICGSTTDAAVEATLPDGLPCTTSNLDAYVTMRLETVAKATYTISVRSPSGTDVGGLSQCSTMGDYVEIDASYNQPLYAPFLGQLFGNPATDTRTISATGEAPCEQ